MANTSNFDTTDASVFQAFSNFLTGVKKPGEKYGSRPCTEDTYNMTHSQMGVAAILNLTDFSSHYNLEDRNGSEKDVENLKTVFELFGFTVKNYPNLTTREIRKTLKKLSDDYPEDSNCLLVAMMSHGNQNGIIYTRDGTMKVDEIWRPFTADKCKNLAGKPKIFLVQACRGNLPDVGAEIEVEPEVSEKEDCFASRSSLKFESERFVISTLADIVIYFSSAEGFPSFRDDNGAWFVQALCATLKDCHESQAETDLMTIFTRINRFISYAKQANSRDNFNFCKQMPVIQSMLTKNVIFNKKK
jgi:hypothetical protein